MELYDNTPTPQDSKKTSLRKQAATQAAAVTESAVSSSTMLSIESTPVQQAQHTQSLASRRKSVYTVIRQENGDKNYWVRIGVGFVNRDDSINIHLNALPVNGQLQIRDYEPEHRRDGAETR